MWAKYKAELKLYHRWGGIYFHYSKSYTRPLRLLSLLTNVILFIFVDALTYDLRDPDDGQCELEETVEGCLTEMSSLSSDEFKCYWNEEDSTCHIRDTETSLSQMLTVAIFASLIGTPFVIAIQLLIQKYLAAETSNNTQVLPSNQTERTSRRSLRRAVSDFYSASPADTNQPAPLRRGATYFGYTERSRSVLPLHSPDEEDGQVPANLPIADT
jgi:hypothetical protein